MTNEQKNEYENANENKEGHWVIKEDKYQLSILTFTLLVVSIVAVIVLSSYLQF